MALRGYTCVGSNCDWTIWINYSPRSRFEEHYRTHEHTDNDPKVAEALKMIEAEKAEETHNG